MGDVVFCCPNCRDPLIVDDQGIGLHVPCPRCSAGIEIPLTAIPAGTVQKLVVDEQVGALPSSLLVGADMRATLRALVGEAMEAERAVGSEGPAPVAGDDVTALAAELAARLARIRERGSVLGRQGASTQETSAPRSAPANLPGEATQPVASSRNLWLAMGLCAALTLGLVLALYVQTKTGFTPAPSQDSIPPETPASRRLVPARLGEPASLGAARLTVHRVLGGPGAVSPDLGDPRLDALVLEVSIENTSRSPIHLAYLWSDTRAVDETRRAVRALVHPGDTRHALVGDPPETLGPGDVLNTTVAFQPIGATSRHFRVESFPGLFARTTAGAFVPAITAGFSVDVARPPARAAAPR